MNFSDVVKNISSNKNTLGSKNENFDKFLSDPDHQEILGKHIVQSLQIIPTEDGITMLEYIPTIQVNHGENFDKNSSFNVSKPHDILPAKVKGRRRASIADCKAARESLSSDISNLITATSEAQKTADLIGMSTDALNGIAKKYEKLRKANYSKSRMLWVRAIRKVIIQLEVAKITKILEIYEQKKKAFLIEKYSKTKIAVLGQSLKILVVDQSHASLTRTARALENCKHAVSKESSGIKASETLQNISFDLIIIDFCSPDIPAEIIITEFREHELTQEIEKKTIVIGLIDHDKKAPENINQTDFVSKINAFLIKPFTLSKLEEILESIQCQEI
jgi:CheY-like chemotaxis protein